MPFHVYYIPERLEQGRNPWLLQKKPVGISVVEIESKQYRQARRACFDLYRLRVPLEQVQANTAQYFPFLHPEGDTREHRHSDNEALRAFRQKIIDRQKAALLKRADRRAKDEV